MHAFSSIRDHIIPKSLKCSHSAIKSTMPPNTPTIKDHKGSIKGHLGFLDEACVDGVHLVCTMG